MSEEPEVLPTDKSLPAPQVTINQFIQLVNQNNRFPDASTLSQYDAETRAWILKRTETEQENRHRILHKLVDNEHALATAKLAEKGKDTRYTQGLGAAVLIIIIIIAAILLAIGKEIQALACVLLVVGPPIVMAISQKVIKTADKKDNEPPSAPRSNG